MEAVVIDAGSKLLKAGVAIPDQAPSMVHILCFTFMVFVVFGNQS